MQIRHRMRKGFGLAQLSLSEGSSDLYATAKQLSDAVTILERLHWSWYF